MNSLTLNDLGLANISFRSVKRLQKIRAIVGCVGCVAENPLATDLS